jgi:four helix bundle protein
MSSTFKREPALPRKKARRVEDLLVWRKACKLVIEVYALTQGFPPEERYRMVGQMRDAVSSIPANISEGFRRRSLKEKSRFINIAEASLEELRTFLKVSRYIGYHDSQQCLDLAEETAKLLYCYHRPILLKIREGTSQP